MLVHVYPCVRKASRTGLSSFDDPSQFVVAQDVIAEWEGATLPTFLLVYATTVIHMCRKVLHSQWFHLVCTTTVYHGPTHSQTGHSSYRVRDDG